MNRQNGTIIINGRRMGFNDGVKGQELINAATNGDPQRRAALYSQGSEFKSIDPNHFYGANQLTDKRGNPVQVKSFPDRSKGMEIPHVSRYRQSAKTAPPARPMQAAQQVRISPQPQPQGRTGLIGFISRLFGVNDRRRGW